MKRLAAIFEKPFSVSFRREPVGAPEAGEVLVKTRFSAISAGTELLIYRGQFPPELTVDAGIRSLNRPFGYPLKYGYASVGQIIAAGSSISDDWIGREVFCFHPHESHYTARPDEIVPIPDDIEPAAALFLPAMETAVNFVMDGGPVIGEGVVIFGQGVVGLLTTALLARFPLQRLVALDRFPTRRETALDLGASAALDPETDTVLADLKDLLASDTVAAGSADLVFELSGNPQALNQAIAAAGFGARIVVGSWYGAKPSSLELGGAFHRNRMRLISSQVSTLGPRFSGRWNKARRLETAWDMIRKIRPARLVTHRYHVSRISDAFELLDQRPQETLQTMICYDE